MKMLTLQKAAKYLETAGPAKKIDLGHAIVLVGTNAAGARFVMVNDVSGKVLVIESM